MPAHSCDILYTGPDKASTSLPSVPPQIKAAIGCKCWDRHLHKDAAMKSGSGRMPARPGRHYCRSAPWLHFRNPSLYHAGLQRARIGSCFSVPGIPQPKSSCQYSTSIVGLSGRILLSLSNRKQLLPGIVPVFASSGASDRVQRIAAGPG